MSRWLIVLIGFAFLNAHAAERQRLFEITPFAGWRAGGDFELDTLDRDVNLDDSGSLALALNYKIDAVSQYELFYSRQDTNLERDELLGVVDTDVEYLHIGGINSYSTERRVVPYIAGGLGVTRFNRDETNFSISVGGGVRVPFSERFSLRLEGRGYVTLVDTDTAFFCRSDGGALCRIRVNGSTFLQFELLAGAAFAF